MAAAPASTLIPHSRPTNLPEAADTLRAVLESGHVGTGEQVRLFEAALAANIGRKHVICTGSGSAALGLALAALRMEQGREVLAPSYVCSAVLNEIKRAGADAKLVDVVPSDMNASHAALVAATAARTSAAVLPHLFGNPLLRDALEGLDVPVIEDCAMAVGGSVGGRAVGSFGLLSVFSFYATKMLTTGQGGAVATDDDALADLIRDLVDYDNRDEWKIRCNHNLSDLNAALGLHQLRRLPAFVARRRELAARYHAALAAHEFEGYWAKTSEEGVFFRYCLSVPDAGAFGAAMAALGIECKRPVFKALHQYLNLPAERYPMSEALQLHCVSLPIYPSLSDADQDRVITAALQTLDA